MSPVAPTVVRRMTLALDAGRCCPEDVLLAVEVAAIIGAELEGLFVEDSDLMDLARLPFAQEFGGRSGQGRPIVRSTVESLLRRRIERVAGELERAGKARNLATTHATARGKVVRQALERAEHRDVLLLQSAGAPAPSAARAASGPVMVWYEDGEQAAAALDIAVELALRLRSELVVGFPAARFATGGDLRGELARRLDRLPGRVRASPVAGAEADAIIAAARAARAAQLVLAARGRLVNEEALERMLRMLGSRVILVGRRG